MVSTHRERESNLSVCAVGKFWLIKLSPPPHLSSHLGMSHTINTNLHINIKTTPWSTEGFPTCLLRCILIKFINTDGPYLARIGYTNVPDSFRISFLRLLVQGKY